jgi:hypothetical protein
VGWPGCEVGVFELAPAAEAVDQRPVLSLALLAVTLGLMVLPAAVAALVLLGVLA